MTYVGGGEYLGYDDGYIRVPVPAEAVAVRAMLFWNGSGSLDLGVMDERARCSLAHIITCQFYFATQGEAEGYHWVLDAQSPATLEFDEAAIREGCTSDECSWATYAYSKADLDTTFHLRVEVDILEQAAAP